LYFPLRINHFFCSGRLFQWRYVKPSQQSLAAAIEELDA